MTATKSRPLRIGLVLVALLLGFLVLQSSVVTAARKSPALLPLAARIAPDNGTVLAAMAQNRFQQALADSGIGQKGGALMSQLKPSRALFEAQELARRALEQNITNVGALSILGFYEQSEGRAERTARIMQASDALSRRDNLTRLWFIENSALRDDPDAMFANFDVALRTSSAIQTQLFPILAQLTNEPGFGDYFVELLNDDPAWGPAFLYSAATGAQGQVGLARIYPRLNRDYTHGGQKISRLIAQALVANREYAPAFTLARAMTPAQGRDRLIHDPAFTATDAIQPFAWQLTSNADFDAARSRASSDTPGLTLLTSGSGSAVVARQLLNLAPGSYRFTSPVALEGDARIALEWRLRCATSDALLGSYDPLAQDGYRWSVPSGCPYQWLELNADAGDSSGDASAFVSPVALARIAG